MFIETLGLSLIVGKIRNGKLGNLEKLHIKGWYLFIIGFVIEITSILMVINTNSKMTDIIVENFFIIHVLIYILVILGLILNIQEKGIWMILIGTILNFLPILANNGRMPVSQEVLSNSYLYTQMDLLKDNRVLTHTLITDNTKFYYLSDIIPIPKPYPFPKIISFGDILIGIGIFLLIQSYMKHDFRKTNMIEFLIK